MATQVTNIFHENILEGTVIFIWRPRPRHPVEIKNSRKKIVVGRIKFFEKMPPSLPATIKGVISPLGGCL